MADRVFVYRFEPLQPTATPGTYQLVLACNFLHDGASQIGEGNAVANINDGMTPAQMQAAAVAAITQLAKDAGYSIASNGNQIIMPSLGKA